MNKIENKSFNIKIVKPRKELVNFDEVLKEKIINKNIGARSKELFNLNKFYSRGKIG